MSTSLDEFFTDHLPYEIWMMREAMKALATRQLSPFETNAFIETFCLHARNLIEFFKTKEACDFDPRDLAVPGFILNKRFIGDAALTQITRQVSHLTKGRRADNAEKITVGDMRTMLREIEAEIDRFVRNLTPKRKAQWELSIAATKAVIQFASGTLALTTTTSASVSSVFINDPKNRLR
jgi:hypothetical protein